MIKFTQLTPALFVGTALMLGTAGAHAIELTDLFNTGVDANGAVLADGAVDPHYTLVSSPDAGFAGPAAQVVNQGFPIGPWIANTAESRWIAPRSDAGNGNAPGAYTYRTTFDLTGFDPSSANITGRWSTDNNGLDILINGISTGQTTTFASFLDFSDFAITSGFVAGINTIDFLVNNGTATANPTGLRVEISGTALPVPEPGTWAMVLAGLAGLGLVTSRRRGSRMA